ncbi:MAG: hypothetical protein ACYSR1_08080, partial [Planctomycetota bacterium]
MAKTKRTKPSKISAKKKAAKKHTTKSMELPESVKWFLDFANLGSKPGKVSLMKVAPGRAINRPPSEPAPPISYLSENDFIDENRNLWCEESGELNFRFSMDDTPSAEEFRDFLSKTEINVGSRYSNAKVKAAWLIANCTFQSKCTPDIGTKG